MTVQTDETAIEAKIKPILAEVKALASGYLTHASGQALAWYTILTHHLTSIENGALAAGALVLTNTIKRVSAWLAK